MSNEPKLPRLIVALDFDDPSICLSLVERLDPALCRLKVGKQLFTTAGPQFVERLINKGFDVFLDLKFHDIPSTVAKAITAACNLGVWMVNVHSSGGEAMLASAKEAVMAASHQPLLIGVTVLTSTSEREHQALGYQRSLEDQVLFLASLTRKVGLDGVVCSAQEAPLLKHHLGSEFTLVTPGIRLSSTDDDQSRVLTPEAAIRSGSHYLVIGRPITQADDPLLALKAISESIQGLSYDIS